MRIGFGYDVHQFAKNRDLILGGINIEFEQGLLGHSDADVCIHSLMDAILGALALGDIGKLFPDTDPAYKDIDSKILLQRVYEVMIKKGYKIGNCDITIACQRPKLSPYIDSMRETIAKILQTSVDNISVKATTTERLGFEGRMEGISSYAVCLLKSFEIME